MSGADSDADRADEITERYRAASAADPVRPGDSVRESVFAYARSVVADQAPRGVTSAHTRRPAANDSSWRLSAAASVIVAVFATLLAWHLHRPAPMRDSGPDPATSELAASKQPATGSSASGEPSAPLPAIGAQAPRPLPTQSLPARESASTPCQRLAAEGTMRLPTQALKAPAWRARGRNRRASQPAAARKMPPRRVTRATHSAGSRTRLLRLNSPPLPPPHRPTSRRVDLRRWRQLRLPTPAPQRAHRW